MLVKLRLENKCKMNINPVEPELGIHYDMHKFSNPNWRPTRVLENYFPISTAESYYSADFNIEDYESSDIEVVLETLFDDKRLHLTEKSLRPIALGQPFILAGTHGSLEYLHSYGFITFNDIWNESYDLIEDPEERLIKIVDLMKQIANWTPWVKERKLAEARAIAEYNRQHFFSQEFSNKIINELKQNLEVSLQELESTNTSANFINWRKQISKNNQVKSMLISEHKYLENFPPITRTNIADVVSCARHYYMRSLSSGTQYTSN